jgi:hypothetical protein
MVGIAAGFLAQPPLCCKPFDSPIAAAKLFDNRPAVSIGFRRF